mgnify:FL=1
MRKLLLSVLLCSALVVGLLPAAAFAAELGNTPEPVEEAPTPVLEEQTVNEELLSEYGEQKNAPGEANPAAQNNAAEVYVSSTGSDEQNTGTKDLPFATLAKAVDAAADGAAIYIMSDLTMDQCARFYDKSLTITSGEGGPYTVTRSADFNRQSDTARSWYNPAMIEVQSLSASSVGLTLSKIILDDAGMYEGTVFAQAVSGDGNADNTIFVQDAIIASNATVPCTVTLGSGAVLRNFGGMSAVRATDQAKIVMESGSVIEDTMAGYTRTKGSAAGSVGPAGAIWLQGGTLVMREGSKLQNMDGRGVYADGGKVEMGGAISSIAANKSAMWQSNSGIAIHLRNNAEGTLTSTALIEKLSGGSVIHCADGARSFKMENGSKITDCPKLNGNVIFAKNSTVMIDGEISNVYATGNHILQTDGGTVVTIGENGRILNNHAYYGAVYINGTDEHLDIYGKINGNISTDRGGGVVLSNNGGNHNAAMYEGAEICNNKAEQTGGGTMISKGIFTMYGGTISGNISGTNSAKGEGDRIGGGVFVRRGGQFIMNGGAIKNNATTAFGGGVCFDASDYGGMVPKIELNAGTINNNLMQVTVDNEYQVTGGVSNDLAVTGKDYGKCDRYLYISREAAVGDQAVYFQTGTKTVTPADSSLDIRLGNTSAANVTALTSASDSMGWNDPLATFWVQRDGAAKLTVGGLTLNDLPVYVLSLPVDETGKVLDASEVQVYADRKTNTRTNTRDIDVTLPDVSGNGYAVAIVQPSQDHGTLFIQGPETIERNKTGEHYPVTYTVTYDMSESMESIIEQAGGNAEYVLVIDQDDRLVGNPGRFNGTSINVTYSLPHSEFRVGDVLLASAMLRITVGEDDYIIPSNVTKTRKVETTYSLTTQVNGGNGTISASKAGLAAGSHETIVFTPDSGYEIDTVTVNGVKAEVLSNMLEVIMDADKTVIVTYKSTPHIHNHGTAWKSDADNHWHECPCGDRKDVAAHSFKWVIDKEPTATRKGSKHEECTVCGYKKAAVAIPAKGSTVKPSDQPGKPGNTASSNTGDSSDPVLWSALLFISGGAVIGTTVVSRKKKYNR